MKRRIHITESQLKEIFKHINENNKLNNEVIEEEAQVTIDGNPYAASNGGNLDLARKDAAKNAVDSGVKLDNANISFDMQESLKKVTKKQIKEARLQKLVKESVKLIRKKDLK
jgi:Asp-tRNA(Asn)/Glu-tRNA(Gln) amidotransferase C subunit